MLRPRTIVELGVAGGTSYCALCQAVDRLGLAARCFGVDSWTGDEHAGFYGKDVLDELATYHNERYGAFSRLVHSRFDAALAHFADASIDLLHIDGLHTYEAARQDFEGWLPKLADPAIVLLHDTNVREQGFGVFRLWAEISEGLPNFEFHHGHGLGVLGVGTGTLPPALEDLFAAGREPARGGQIRRRFARLGAAIEDGLELRRHRAARQSEIAGRDHEIAVLVAQGAEQDARLKAAAAERRAIEDELACVRAELRSHQLESTEQQGRIAALQDSCTRLAENLEESGRRRHESDAALADAAQAAAALGAELEACRSMLEVSTARLAAIEGSTTWRATAGTRRFLGRHRALARLARRAVGTGARLEPVASRGPAPAPAPAGAMPGRGSSRPRIVLVSGEPHTPGHLYRVERMAAALPPALFEVRVLTADAVEGMAPPAADLIWIWRACCTPALGALVESARARGCRIVYDLDDLMFRPDLATVDVIDGIRSQDLAEADVQRHYQTVRSMLAMSDHATTPTVPLAREIRELGKAVTVIPNGFDRETLAVARRARESRRRRPDDGLLRIGYASGSRTHQRDFRIVAGALAALLAERAEARLVLFHQALDIAEFPELDDHASRIEWRDIVALPDLPLEYARFDINLAPLEVGNLFCEAKSELKFFEAALVEVPTIASPTEPFAQAIRHGRTGFLADQPEEWLDALRRLAADRGLRDAVGRQARHDTLWQYGPERRAHLATRLIRRLLSPPDLAATIAGAELAESIAAQPPPPPTVPFDLLLQSPRRGESRASVVIPLYNYGHLVVEALDSVLAQSRRDIDIVVVDDCSTDDSAAVAQAWLKRHGAAFSQVSLLRHRANAKLGTTRNTAVAFSETELFLPLDADNLLLPTCIEQCIAALDRTGAAAAYPTIEIFGEHSGWHYRGSWDPILMRGGNVIDAMAMIRKGCWAAVGGYAALNLGWEDYDFWCKFIEAGFFGVRVEEVTARYRAHGKSMLRTVTELPGNKRKVVDDIVRRHPWLLPGRSALPAETGGERTGPTHGSIAPRLLRLLRCPQTGEPLRQVDDATLETIRSRRRWPVVAGRPVFTGAGFDVQRMPDGHLSNPLPPVALSLIAAAAGPILNLSAGGTAERHADVVQVELAIFRHTDLVADAHRLPFADASFQLVLSLNAFEHYRDPELAMREIHRVLAPGGRLLVHTAFLQPLHEAPHHFFGCTRYGLEHWLRHFEIEDLQVSENFDPAYSLSWICSTIEEGLQRGATSEAAAQFRDVRAGTLAELWRGAQIRESSLWGTFSALPADVREAAAAGFQAVARKASFRFAEPIE